MGKLGVRYIFCDVCVQWCIAKNGGGYTLRGVAKGLKVPCLFMITEVSIRCQKKPGGWYTAYTRVYPPIHHCVCHCVLIRSSVLIVVTYTQATCSLYRFVCVFNQVLRTL